MAESRNRVVIVGGGFGGLSVAQYLKGLGLDITLVDRRNHHLFQPLLYQVATAALATSEIAWPIRTILRDRKDVRTLLGTVTGVDTARNLVILEDGTTLPYDTLVIATGATHAYFGNDAWEAHAPGLKTLEDATRIRRRLLLAFEAAEREPDPARRAALLTFVVIGGGPTGVEMAGAIIELARAALRDEFRAIDPKSARVVLIEGADRVLGNFEPQMSEYSAEAMRKLGVEVELGQNVTAIDANGVTYGDKRIGSETVIWAAGVQASSASKWLGAEADKAGRVKVGRDLTVPGHSDIFVIGDTALVLQHDGKPVPGIADGAKQAGQFVAETIARRLTGDRGEVAFAYRHKGSLATIGKREAVVDFGTVRFKGRFAWWLWGVAHIYFLIDGKNRFSVAVSWLWIYLTGRRASRLITQGEAEQTAPLEEIDTPAETKPAV